MILYSTALLVGFLVLFKSADQFVIGSIATARNFSVSPMIIGLTIVALGTSAPEIFIAAGASFENQPELAVGNAIGSNIANVGMVLGIMALVVPLKFRAEILHNDLPILVFVTLCAGASLIDYRLDIWDGVLLVGGLCLFLYRLAREHRKATNIVLAAEISEARELPRMSNARAITTFVLSLIFLLLSSELLVWAASRIAQVLEISELVIGLTVIAIGTSLPELVVCMTSALKGQADMAMGNIIGSNIFNILAVFSIPCILAPVTMEPGVLFRDYGTMLGLTLVLVLFTYPFRGRVQVTLGRFKGIVLLLLWVGYLAVLSHGSVHAGSMKTVPTNSISSSSLPIDRQP